MADTKRGINFEIGGNTAPLTKALRESKEEVKLLASETKKLQGEFKFDPNLDKVNEMLKTNKKSAEELSLQIKMLEQGLEKIERTGRAENISSIKSMTKDLNLAKAALMEVNAEAARLEKLKLSDFNKELELSTKKAELLKERLDIKIDKNAVAEFQKAAREQIEKTNEKLLQLKKIMSDISDADPDASSTKEFKELENQVIALDNELKQAAKSIREVNQMRLDDIKAQFDKVGDGFINAGKALAPLSAAITGAVGLGVKAAVDYEKAFAGVRKNIETTEEDFNALSDSIKAMSEEIPVAAAEIAKLVATAGQLGIQRDGIEDFTKVVANLGATTNLAGENGAAMLAKFANITQMPVQDYERLGSTILKLDTSSATSANSIVEMAMRLAAAGKQAGMTEAQILGISAALASVGLEAQAGGSAVSKTLANMQVAVETNNSKLKDFAAIAGMSAEQFAKAFREDATNALLEFIKGLSAAEEKGSSAIVLLNEMGISELRVRDALLRAASAGDLFNEVISTGTTAWEENTALTEKTAEIYSTTASQMQIMKNQIENLGASFGDLLLPVVNKIIGGVSDFVGWLNSLDEGTKNNILRIGLFVAALAPALAITGNMTKTVGSLITQVMALTGAKAAEVVVTDAATGAQIKLNAAQAANPIGLVVTAIGTLVAILGAAGLAGALTGATDKTAELNKKVEESRQAYENLTISIEENANKQRSEIALLDDLTAKYSELVEEQDGTTESKKALESIIKDIQRILPDFIAKINEETGAYINQTDAIIDLRKEKARLLEENFQYDKAYTARTRIDELDTQIPDLKKAYDDAQQELNDAYNNLKKISPVLADALYDIFLGDEIKKSENAYDAWQSAKTERKDNQAILDGYLNSGGKIAESDSSTTRFRSPEHEEAYYRSLESQEPEKTPMTKEEYEKKIALIDKQAAQGVLSEIEALEKKKAINDEYLEKGTTERIKADTNYIKEKARLYEKSEKDIFEAELADIKLKKEKGLISEKESLEQIRDLKLSFYADDAKAKTEAEAEYQAGINKLNKSTESGGSSTAKSKSEKEEKAKTPEDLYKEEKTRQDLLFNAQKDGDKNYEKLLQDRIDLQQKYLVKGSDEWLRAEAEIIKMREDIEKKKTDADKKAADAKLKTDKDTYDKALTLLKYSHEDGEKTWKEYHDDLVKLQEENNEYLSDENNTAVARSLSKEITKALTESQKETIAALKEDYAEELIDFKDFIAQYKDYADEFYAEDKELRKKAYDDIEKITADYCAGELAKIQKFYDDELISLDEYIEQYRDKLAEFYEADSDEYKKGEQKITSAKEAAYREEKERLDWLKDIKIISDIEYFETLAELTAEYLDEDSRLWQESIKAQIRFMESEHEKALKAREKSLKDQQKLLDDNLKDEEKRINEQKKIIEQQYKDELKIKQDAIKAAHDEKIKAIDAELEAERFRLNVIISGINDEIKARRELREDDNHEDKIARAKKALEAAQAEAAHERDDFTRVNLEHEVIRKQQELDKLMQDKGDTEFYRTKESEKTAVQEQIKSLEDTAKAAKQAANDEKEAALEAAAATGELTARLAELDREFESIKFRYEHQTEVINTLISHLESEINCTNRVIGKYSELAGKTVDTTTAKENLTEATKQYQTKIEELLPKLDLEKELYRQQAEWLEKIRDLKREIAAMSGEASATAADTAEDSPALALGYNANLNEKTEEIFRVLEALDFSFKHQPPEVKINITSQMTDEQAERVIKPIVNDSIKGVMEG